MSEQLSESLWVERPDGRLHAVRYQPGRDVPSTGPVVALHGITAHQGAWRALAEQWPTRPLVALDLRGRGRSASLPGPSSMARHADDALAVLDTLGIQRAVLMGHSMGGFVALALAAAHPDRVAAVVLVDGGLPLPVPEGVPARDVVRGMIGPAYERLNRTFTSTEEYRDYWRAHPALGPYWNRAIEDYVDADLIGSPPELRSACVLDRVAEDAEDVVGTDGPARALRSLRAPALFLRAERGLLDQEGGLYPPELVDRYRSEQSLVDTREVRDVNHYTILLGPNGLDQVRREVDAFLDACS